MTQEDLSLWKAEDGKPWRHRRKPRRFAEEPLSLQAVSIPQSARDDHFQSNPNDHSSGFHQVSRDPPAEPVVNFDRVPSRTGEEPQDAPPQPFGGWQQDIWNLLWDEGYVDPGEDRQILHVTSYFIDHEHHRRHETPRPLTFAGDFATWEADVRLTWEDLIDPAVPFSIDLIRPDPPVFALRGTVASVIVHQRPIPGRVTCLTTAVFASMSMDDVVEVAHSLPHFVHPQEVLARSGVGQVCADRLAAGFGACSLHHGFAALPLDQVLGLTSGQSLTIRIPAPMSIEDVEHNLVLRVQNQQRQQRHAWQDPLPDHPEDTHTAAENSGVAPEGPPEDATSFMARTPRMTQLARIQAETAPSPDIGDTSSSGITGTDEWRLAMVFCLDGTHIQLDAPWDDADRLWELLAQHFHIPVEDVLRAHHVGSRPSDLEREELECLLLRRRQDIPAADFMRLVLVDIEYKADHRGPAMHLERKARWLPRRCNRETIIRLVGFDGHCSINPYVCDVWYNKEYLAVGDSVVRITDGDYLHVAIPSHPEDQLCDTSESFQEEGEDEVMVPSSSSPTSNLEDDTALLTLSSVVSLRPRVCKLEDHSEIDAPDFTRPLHAEPEQGRPELQIGEHGECLEALHLIWSHHAAVEREDEGRVLYVSTWFSDPGRWPRCPASRPVRLLNNAALWLDHLCEAWDDRLDPDVPIHFYLLNPQPRQNPWDSIAQPHLLILQNPTARLRSVHFAVLDAQRAGLGLRQHVDVLPVQVNRAQVLESLLLSEVCHALSEIDCMVWWGDFELRGRFQLPLRQGYSFFVIINQLGQYEGDPDAAGSGEPPPALVQQWPYPSFDSDNANATPGDDGDTPGVSLLQLQAQRTTLRLADLLDDDVVSPGRRPSSSAFRLHWASGPEPHPSFLEVPHPISVEVVQRELQTFGLDCFPVICEEIDTIVCLPQHDPVLPDRWHHYVLIELQAEEVPSPLLHSADHELDEQQLMSLLYKLGFWRAVVTRVDSRNFTHKVCFQNQKVELQSKPAKEPRLATWPSRQQTYHPHGPFYVSGSSETSDCTLDLGITDSDVQQLLLSHHDVLCPDFEGVDLPDSLRTVVQACDNTIEIDQLDRLLIYSDGSSMGSAKHLPPLRAEEEGLGDTWAYIVLGERYEPPGLRFLGWQAQTVHYDPSSNVYIGAPRVGADVAEREGLAWAALWRLSFNRTLPTCFRSDSSMALGQAEGTLGSAQLDESFAFLRGCHQAVAAAIGPDRVLYSHVPGHAGEPFNELCDFLAKAERQRSFYCRRPRLQLERWKRNVRHLWLVFNQFPDVPPFNGQGISLPPPTLPPAHIDLDLPSASTSAQWESVSMTLSICTANVQSLSAQPDGHGGKVMYLRRQMRELCLNVIGFQETRAEDLCSCADDVLRLASGSHQRQQGVELWVNLAQPIGFIHGKPQFFAKKDFQIAYKDSRTLLVRADAAIWSGWFLVGYAPHSGKSWQEREDWWHHFGSVAHRRPPADPLIVMLDANAAPGGYDGVSVFRTDLRSSSGTPLLRQFVHEHGLFLPSTTAAHRGSMATWTDPSGEHHYCIDYVLLSEHFWDRCHLSQLVPQFDLGGPHWDHTATAVDTAWTTWRTSPSLGVKRPQGYDPQKINTASTKAMLASHQPASWSTDIEHHVDHLNAALLQGLRTHCPKEKQQPKKSYITEEIWGLRQTKLQCKRKLHRLLVRSREEQLITLFAAWRSVRLEATTSVPNTIFWDY
eukprot:s1029_g5.t1